MRKFLQFSIGLLTVFCVSAIVFAAVSLQYFTAKNNSEGILVEWKTVDEGNTVKFDLERSVNTPDNFLSLNTKGATGSNSYYSYQDNSVEARTSSSTIYYYRLKCSDASGNYTYTNHITVSHTVSGIRSTWGSIKAIFR
ncbi:MAG: hypothetical protein JSS63_07300 [Bacteroidetes bacterium]|nr:hypothetical protein [Bacteroidota bacterium]MBX7044833.1 hypothetical protein [Ignavibacteria bacterium]